MNDRTGERGHNETQNLAARNTGALLFERDSFREREPKVGYHYHCADARRNWHKKSTAEVDRRLY